MEAIEQIPQLLSRLYKVVAELENLFPGRHFTPDGHLVGSIGEVLAAYHYDIALSQASTETHDGKTRDGKQVQIKATRGNQVGLRSKPDHLLVLRIGPRPTPEEICEEIYNGPGQLAWENAGSVQRNGQRSISVTKLRNLLGQIPIEDRLPRTRP